MDTTKYKDTTVRRGHSYHYYYSPAAADKPTLLFVHGFPSTSYDWARQVAHFTPLGYGILIPDCLGFGGTSKPTDTAEFRHKLIADDLMDLVDAERLTDVVAIGHDWGSGLVSALVHYYQNRFLAFAWLAVSYLAPSPGGFDLDTALKAYKEAIGSEVIGYWKVMDAPDGPMLLEEKMDSFLQLTFPMVPEWWLDNLCPSGTFRQWLEDDRQPGRPDWWSQEDYNHSRHALLKGGMASSVNYYKVIIHNCNLADQMEVPEEKWYVKKPVLFFAANRDYVGLAVMGKQSLAKYAPDAEIIDLNVGHWPQLEATQEVNEGLENWLLKLPSAAA
ncbi:alpha/beta-hydrolase [Epithele typhae]|uniref:alpha/beta-hydrolase n=1 Tax=Epithele typhae TaxID=378194 RepID=UPI002008C4D2|nr:alpha/beta-hydrolase [Epithele typhae]KAH9940022.1 alpha/beta-hydrolase [Epithele typhae]